MSIETGSSSEYVPPAIERFRLYTAGTHRPVPLDSVAYFRYYDGAVARDDAIVDFVSTAEERESRYLSIVGSQGLSEEELVARLDRAGVSRWKMPKDSLARGVNSDVSEDQFTIHPSPSVDYDGIRWITLTLHPYPDQRFVARLVAAHLEDFNAEIQMRDAINNIDWMIAGAHRTD